MKKLLLIDDDIDFMILSKGWLETSDYEVECTVNAKHTKDIIEDFVPDLVIIDIYQKDILKHLKDHENTCTAPVILMTDYAYTLKYQDLPVDDTIEKPFDLHQLLKKIKKLTQLKPVQYMLSYV